MFLGGFSVNFFMRLSFVSLATPYLLGSLTSQSAMVARLFVSLCFLRISV